MRKSNSETQEGSDRPLIEDIHQIEYISLGEGAATCQVCGSSLHEGAAVVVYVFRPAGSVRYEVGHVVCGDGRHERPGVFTVGVRELIVGGRVGWCSDGATQSAWPVLLEPDVLAVSAASMKSIRLVPDGGSSPENVAADVEKPDTPGSLTKVSFGEAQRRAGRPGDDVVRGLFWGGER